MAYVTPNSNVILLHNVPLDNTYRDTIYFSSKAEQTSYFMGLAKYNNIQYSYIRKERVIRVGIECDNLLDCNYLMFKNTAFGDKWFYGFITNVEYVNNETSSITYVLDCMQSYFFDYTLHPSFVEREHSSVDGYGTNLIEENFDTGEYEYKDLGIKGMSPNFVPVVCATVDEDYNDAIGLLNGGVYQGCRLLYFEGINATRTWLEGLVEAGKQDAVISMFMFPLAFITTGATDKPKSTTFQIDKPYDNIDGYVPKNKKLFSYPYVMLYGTNNSGRTMEYRYEDFSDGYCGFECRALYSPNPEACVIPTRYKQVASNYNERLVLDNFPQCSWSSDTYKAWLAMNQNSIGVNLAQNIGKVAAGVGVATVALGSVMASGGATLPAVIGGATAGTESLMAYGEVATISGSGISGMMNIMNLIGQAQDKSLLPPALHGTTTGGMNTAMDECGFHFYYAHIKSQYAKVIDNFWTMYGYPCHLIKVPNRNVRPHWTYTKTVDVSITGSVPANAMKVIKTCYNNGITFWKNGSEVGNYSLDNSLS